MVGNDLLIRAGLVGGERERFERNKRADVRRLTNNPWNEPAVSPADAARVIAAPELGPEREHGVRVLVRCWLPSVFSEPRTGLARTLDDLHAVLGERFGGFTVIADAEGYWRGEHEAGAVYEVSVRPADAPRAVDIFEHAGRALNQEWTHITTQVETAHHVRTGGNG